MHICCITSERHVHSYRIRTSGYFSSCTIVHTGFVASLNMLDSSKLFAFYLKSGSGVGKNSDSFALLIEYEAPEEMFNGHETYLSLFILNFMYFCANMSHG